MKHFMLAVSVTAFACVNASAETALESGASEKMLGPTSADATGKNFTDARGRRWVSSGKVKLEQKDVAKDERRYTDERKPTASIDSLTVDELAEKLRPRRLVGEFEYRLAEPDKEIAAKMLARAKAAPTDGHKPRQGGEPRFIIGSDDRTRVDAPRFYPGSVSGYVSPQNCTITMIGPSTALGAAHCYYWNGWISTNAVTLGADTVNPTAPFGSFQFDSITLPGAWNAGEWDWDFAVIEFSPTRRPGDSTGWFGTEENSGGTQRMIGYPTDKAVPSQWLKRGTYTASPGSRYEHNLDVIPGDSGACAFNDSDRCTGIQSTQWTNSTRTWNEVRRWDRVTYDFFDAYGNWP